MTRPKAPVTPAVRALKAAGVAYTEHLYAYEPRGGTRVSARELGVPEHHVVKTLVMQDDRGAALLALMHGDMTVSTGALARQIGARDVVACDEAAATRHTGYLVGGTSPFGTRRELPVCLEASIADLDRGYVNGGKRGFLVGLASSDLVRLLSPRLVRAGTRSG